MTGCEEVYPRLAGHKTLWVTPAMEVEIADHVWTLEEIAGLAE